MVGGSSHPAALYKLRRVTRVTALVILLLVVVGFFMPTDYRVERGIFIQAPKATVYKDILRGDYLADWMFIQDGQLEAFDGVLKAGDSVALIYEKTSDQGVLSIVSSSESVIRFDVRPKSNVNLVHNQIMLSDAEGGTLVNWVIDGDLSAGLLSPYLALFANDIAGNNFERSLNQLKVLIERQD